ncbi:MAG: GTP cyclohydrolase II [Deltaproteobacteria bacterium]|nr:GTP cyclohydrolase II [Deltaproteobacteria bacterium]
MAESRLTTTYGEFLLMAYWSVAEPGEHLAIIKGTFPLREPVLVRLHSQCLTGEVLGSLQCDCGEQLHEAFSAIKSKSSGVLLYLPQEGRGIGLVNKIRAYALQEKGVDTVEANIKLGFAPDQRHYGVAAGILKDLGIRSVRLLTNNPDKIQGLEQHGVQVCARVPIITSANGKNNFYLAAKQKRLGHLFGITGVEPSEVESANGVAENISDGIPATLGTAVK